jgi:predicted nuclease of predicted toxin-antitoxin system
MKLLLDMGIGRRAAALLREWDMDAVHLGERGLARLADQEVLAVADDEGRAVVTLDADFSALLALSAAGGPSVVHIRVQGLDYMAAAQLIEEVVTAIEDELASGCIASVTSAGVRVRRLPISPPE